MTIRPRAGFTLIEISLVLVIIGLLIGGVLGGVDLIAAARVRSQITQLEQYQTAVNTFQAKYDCLPGDCRDAAQFGFGARGNVRGTGDGNGLFEGFGTFGASCGICEMMGETVVFWVDLSAAGLIDGTFNTASSTVQPSGIVSGDDIGLYIPKAKIGGGNHIYIYSGGTQNNGVPWYTNNINYFGISAVTSINPGSSNLANTPNLTTQQAFMIDSKLDDGNPQTGKVIAQMPAPSNTGMLWAYQNANYFDRPGADPGVADNASAKTCYDNGGDAAAPMHYTTNVSSGDGLNCALSFKFQ